MRITAAVPDERDAPFRLTGVISVVRQAVDSVGLLGTCALVTPLPLEQVNEALAASYSGEVLKPILRMP